MSRRKRRIGDEDERRSRSYSPKHKRSRTNKENHEQLQSKGVAKKSWEQYSEDESSGDENYSESRSRQHRGRHSRSESNRYQESHSESRSKKNRERHSEWESRRNLEPHSESSETGQQTCSEGERNRNWGSHLQEKMKRVQDIHSKSEKNDGHTGDIPLSEKKMDSVNLRSGGAYIPPAKLKMLQEKITDKGSIEYQRIAWEALKKSLTGLTNKVSVSNIHEVVREIFRENVIRGRGVLARAIIQAQAMSPTFTPIYAALVAIINSKFPQIGELILKRLIIQFKRSFRRNDRQVCVPAVQFIGHLLNQEVAHEVLVLEILTLLLESATDDAIELAIALLKNCGMKLTELSSRGITAIFESIRHLNYGPALSKRVRYMIDVIYAIRKDNFKDYVSVPEGLDLVDEDDKFTHLLTLEDAKDPEDILNVFKFDPDYVANEEKYKEIQRELLGESESEASDSASDSESDGEEEEEKAEENQKIHDLTETNLVALRRNIYLTIQSSLDFEECAHKLLKLELNPGQIVEMCYMILDCCAQQRTYEKFYGLLAQRFCQLNKVYVEPFTDIFKVSYETIHRFETNKLRNVAKFFAHLLYTDAISWMVLSCIKLNEDDTTSSNRIFIKILFQELCEYMGLKKLNDRVKDVTLQEAFDGLFPRDNPRNTRFAINFFTSIGLGGLTDELREHLKSAPKSVPPASASLTVAEESESSSSTSSSSFDSEDSEQSDEPKQKEKTRKKTTPPKKSSKKKKEKKHKKSSKSKKKKKR